jgi:hypothetical protein
VVAGRGKPVNGGFEFIAHRVGGQSQRVHTLAVEQDFVLRKPVLQVNLRVDDFFQTLL